MLVDMIFKALADPTRLRTMRLLSAMELAVGELAQVLGQSQPRVSRHVGILCDAGLAERRREGSWVFLRQASGQASGEALDPDILASIEHLLAITEERDPEFAKLCDSDRRKLASIRDARDQQAEDYFAR
ncbi:MAG: metalloregulator ArsR/SmtB family transcription factor, partial [Pseudomonadota bacterium]